MTSITEQLTALDSHIEVISASQTGATVIYRDQQFQITCLTGKWQYRGGVSGFHGKFTTLTEAFADLQATYDPIIDRREARRARKAAAADAEN